MRSRARIIKMAECGTWRVQVKRNSRYRKCLNRSQLKMGVGNRDGEESHVWEHGSADRSFKCYPLSPFLFGNSLSYLLFSLSPSPSPTQYLLSLILSISWYSTGNSKFFFLLSCIYSEEKAMHSGR